MPTQQHQQGTKRDNDSGDRSACQNVSEEEKQRLLAKPRGGVAESCCIQEENANDDMSSLAETSTTSTGYVISYQNCKDECVGKGDVEIKSIDDAIEYLGVGDFQKMLLLISGLCFACDSVEVTMLSFLSPTVQAEWNLEPWQSSTIASVVFAGALIGTLVFGRLGDVIGRRPTFLWMSFAVSLFGFATAFVNDFVSLLCIRFIVGMGVGGIVVAYDLLAEFLPSKSRGSYLMMIEYFWTGGSMFVPLVAAFTLAYSWRLFASICSVPCFVSAVAGYFMLPESPRWLAVKGRTEEAMAVLQRVAVVNGKDPSVLTNVQMEEEEEEEEESCNVADLFKPSWRRLTLAIWGIWAAFGFCYYGVVLMIPRVFESGESNSEEEDCLDETDCSPQGDNEVDFDFNAIFFTATAELLGVAILVYVIDRLGRVPSQIASYACGGVCIAVLCGMVVNGERANSHGMTHMWMLAFAFLGRACEMIGSCATYIITAELLPTEIRTTGHSAANAVSRLGAFCSPYLVRSNLSFPVIGGILLLVHLSAVFLSAQLPETKGRSLSSNHHDEANDDQTQDSDSTERSPMGEA